MEASNEIYSPVPYRIALPNEIVPAPEKSKYPSYKLQNGEQAIGKTVQIAIKAFVHGHLYPYIHQEIVRGEDCKHRPSMIERLWEHLAMKYDIDTTQKDQAEALAFKEYLKASIEGLYVHFEVGKTRCIAVTDKVALRYLENSLFQVHTSLTKNNSKRQKVEQKISGPIKLDFPDKELSLLELKRNIVSAFIEVNNERLATLNTHVQKRTEFFSKLKGTRVVFTPHETLQQVVLSDPRFLVQDIREEDS